MAYVHQQHERRLSGFDRRLFKLESGLAALESEMKRRFLEQDTEYWRRTTFGFYAVIVGGVFLVLVAVKTGLASEVVRQLAGLS